MVIGKKCCNQKVGELSIGESGSLNLSQPVDLGSTVDSGMDVTNPMPILEALDLKQETSGILHKMHRTHFYRHKTVHD